MSQATIVKIDEIETIERGNGVLSTPLITKSVYEDTLITTGITKSPFIRTIAMNKSQF
jgi:hypothetical protein